MLAHKPLSAVRHVVVEGPIGVGKTSLARLLGEPARPVRVCFLEPILHAEQAGRRGIAQAARERVEAAMAAA